MIGQGQPGYLIGIDLAKRRDYTALAIVHRTPAPVASIGADRTRYHYGDGNRDEMNRWAEEDLLPRVERAVNQRFAGRGT